MKVLYRYGLSAVLPLILFIGTADRASAQCLSGTRTAELQQSGPFAGLYKYTLDLSWDLPQGLSNVTLDCGLGACPALACVEPYFFDAPAGSSENTPGPGVCVTTTLYSGEFNCMGNPSIGVTVPVIKWDADPATCEPHTVASGTLWFYTAAGPAPNSQAAIIAIKDGQNVCEGTVVGDCPAVCTVPVDEATWGTVKSKYR